MFRQRRLAVFRKGALRYLILQLLNESPTHGYEVMKRLGAEFGGIYHPSAGAIYPNIEALQEEGYIAGTEKEGKKVYTITSKGKAYLKEGKDKVQSIIAKRRDFLAERKPLNRELRNITSLILTNYRDLEKEKAEEIAQVLKEARRKISDIIFE